MVLLHMLGVTIEGLAQVREVQFITQLKSKMGPPQAVCYQTQRQLLYAGDHLVFDTSQVCHSHR